MGEGRDHYGLWTVGTWFGLIGNVCCFLAHWVNNLARLSIGNFQFWLWGGTTGVQKMILISRLLIIVGALSGELFIGTTIGNWVLDEFLGGFNRIASNPLQHGFSVFWGMLWLLCWSVAVVIIVATFTIVSLGTILDGIFERVWPEEMKGLRERDRDRNMESSRHEFD